LLGAGLNGVRFELQATDHPPSQEQRSGITAERLVQVAEQIEHGWKHPQWDANQF